jgi:hypothetical protein
MAVQKTIDMTAWLAQYKKNTATAGDKLVSKYNSRSGIVDALTSDAAVQNFKTNVVSDLAVKTRTAKLKAVGDAGLHAGMTAHGATNYQTRTSQSAAKAAANVTPYMAVLQDATNKLPARTSDPAANVANRVTPIAVALRNAKKALYGAT